MSSKKDKFFSLKKVQFKQLLSHKARAIMLMLSLCFSFTLFLTFFFATLNFAPCAIVTYENQATLTVDLSNNRESEVPFEEKMQTVAKSEYVIEHLFQYRSQEIETIQYKEMLVPTSIYTREKEEMHLSIAQSRSADAFKVDNFVYGDYPTNENEVVLHEKVAEALQLDLSNQDASIVINDKSYKVTGIFSKSGMIGTSVLMLNTAYTNETVLDSVTFTLDSVDHVNAFKTLLSRNDINTKSLDGNKTMVNATLLIEGALLLLSIGFTLITMLMYYSNFKSLIKRLQKQSCILYYLGYSKGQTTRDLMFKIIMIGTAAFLLAAAFSSLIGLIIYQQKSLVFGGMTLYAMALPNLFGFIIGYLFVILFMVLMFYRSIKRITLKLPNAFGDLS